MTTRDIDDPTTKITAQEYLDELRAREPACLGPHQAGLLAHPLSQGSFADFLRETLTGEALTRGHTFEVWDALCREWGATC